MALSQQLPRRLLLATMPWGLAPGDIHGWCTGSRGRSDGGGLAASEDFQRVLWILQWQFGRWRGRQRPADDAARAGLLVGAALGLGAIVVVIPNLTTIPESLPRVFVGTFLSAWVAGAASLCLRDGLGRDVTVRLRFPSAGPRESTEEVVAGNLDAGALAVSAAQLQKAGVIVAHHEGREDAVSAQGDVHDSRCVFDGWRAPRSLVVRDDDPCVVVAHDAGRASRETTKGSRRRIAGDRKYPAFAGELDELDGALLLEEQDGPLGVDERHGSDRIAPASGMRTTCFEPPARKTRSSPTTSEVATMDPSFRASASRCAYSSA